MELLRLLGERSSSFRGNWKWYFLFHNMICWWFSLSYFDDCRQTRDQPSSTNDSKNRRRQNNFILQRHWKSGTDNIMEHKWKEGRQLTIKNVRRTDSALYRCVAENSLGNVTSHNTTLEVHCKLWVFLINEAWSFSSETETVHLAFRAKASLGHKSFSNEMMKLYTIMLPIWHWF